MNTKTIQFYADAFRLNGTLHLPEPRPENRPAPVVIGSHGLLSDGESPKQKTLAERLNKKGIAFFRFDHRGRGRSEGRFSEATTFEGRINDLAAAISTVSAYPGIGGAIGLFGSSMGGAVCIGVADSFDIETIITLAAPARLESIRVPAHIMEDPLFKDMTPEQMAFDIADKLEKISNILIFHGDADEVVSFENALEIYENTATPKRLVRFPGGDHAISRPDYQAQFIDEAVEWFAAALNSKINKTIP